ncbi:MAG: pyruvate kinase [Planctomycetota bacterium]
MTTNGRTPRQTANAKIVATLGPASSAPDVVGALIGAGADAFRLNFSHGAAGWHRDMAASVRAAAGDEPVAIIADLQGPRIRIGTLSEPVAVSEGGEVVLAAESQCAEAAGVLPTTYDALAGDVGPGDRILIDNGLVELSVLECRAGQVRCRVTVGGQVGSRKGINLPGVAVSAPALTEKDKEDAETAVRFGADYIALSFVRAADDVSALKSLLRQHDADVPVIAKIERAEAVEQIDAIIAAADGVMVARGDLGVELPQEKVPAIQKRIIALANAAGKPVITATEMLQSMVGSPRPTRAEASDVANAILDGTDAAMLSGETAVGRYPVHAVETMERITREAETIRRELEPPPRVPEPDDFADAVADAACAAARQLDAAALAVFTMSGRTARLVAQRRPNARLIALTPSVETRRRLSLVWGVVPLLLPAAGNAETMAADGDRLLKEKGFVRAGDVVVIVGGAGPAAGATNFTKIHTVR